MVIKFPTQEIVMPNKGSISINLLLLEALLKATDTWMLRYLHIEQLLLGQGVDYRYMRELTKTEIIAEAKKTWLHNNER